MATICSTCKGNKRVPRRQERAWWEVVLLRPTHIDDLCTTCGGIGVVFETPSKEDAQREALRSRYFGDESRRDIALPPVTLDDHFARMIDYRQLFVQTPECKKRDEDRQASARYVFQLWLDKPDLRPTISTLLERSLPMLLKNDSEAELFAFERNNSYSRPEIGASYSIKPDSLLYLLQQTAPSCGSPVKSLQQSFDALCSTKRYSQGEDKKARNAFELATLALGVLPLDKNDSAWFAERLKRMVDDPSFDGDHIIYRAIVARSECSLIEALARRSVKISERFQAQVLSSGPGGYQGYPSAVGSVSDLYQTIGSIVSKCRSSISVSDLELLVSLPDLSSSYQDMVLRANAGGIRAQAKAELEKRGE